jgi:hypothetical protein
MPIWPYFFHLKLSYTRYNSKKWCCKKVCASTAAQDKTQKNTFKLKKYLKNRVIFIKYLKTVMSICEFYKFIYFMSGKTALLSRGVFFDDTVTLGYIRYNSGGKTLQ